jgi:hypothetical protein
LKDSHKQAFTEVKAAIGTELFNRFMKGFNKDKNASAEDNDKVAHSEFLFKKLKF